MVDSRIAREHPVPDSRHRFTRVYGRSLYRALAIAPFRHRRVATPVVLFRRLLSLDYILENVDLPWLATEQEKVAYFTGRGIEANLLPQRLYGGAIHTRRYFALKLPIAGGDHSVNFVYADPGRETQRELRRWANVHRALWSYLRAAGAAVHVAVVTRTATAQRYYSRRLDTWLARPASNAAPTPKDNDTLTSVEAALLNGDSHALAQWGSSGGVNRIAVQLRRRVDHADAREVIIDSYSTHHSRHLAPKGPGGQPALIRPTGRR
ncbi:MAG: hypothetical protein OXH70_16755 [Acidobacteria bacterium]|nr:hypothetical protein [Acidobacteriota bacterium]MCY3970278.1 hypothetical protein [Acidobacteriota bacterium]